MVKRIKHNDLLPWFTEDHGQLPASYLKSTQKFFDGLKATSVKLQAPSGKRQATRAKVSTLLNAILPDRKV